MVTLHDSGMAVDLLLLHPHRGCLPHVGDCGALAVAGVQVEEGLAVGGHLLLVGLPQPPHRPSYMVVSASSNVL